MDNFDQCFLCTLQIDEAFIQIFKCTSKEAFLKIDAFIVGRLAGVLAQQGQNKQVHTRTEIHWYAKGTTKITKCTHVLDQSVALWGSESAIQG